MTKSFCTRCGAKVEENATFCTACGAPIATAQLEQVAGPVVSSPDRQANAAQQPLQAAPSMQQASRPAHSAQKKFKLPIAVIIASCIVIVAALVLIVMFVVLPALNGSGSSSSTPVATSRSAGGSAGDDAATSASGHTPPVFSTVTVSTQLPGDSDTSDYGASNLTDGLSDTAWNEGAPGDGAGEWIRFSASAPQRVSAVRIMGGFPKLYKDGSDVYPKNPRPKEITVSYNGGAQTFTMQDLRGEFQTLTLAKPADTTEITITIDSVYPGTKYSDCCIAEVEFQ